MPKEGPKDFMETRKFVIKTSDFIEFKRKNLARRQITQALRKNLIAKSCKCELCDEIGRTSAHHKDYGRPLEVLWLCDSCHGKVHRSKHPLNPKNNKQTPTNISWEKGESVQVTFSIPAKHFIAIKKLSQKSGIPISKLIRREVIKDFPVQDRQLEFNFEEKNDDAQYEKIGSIHTLEKDNQSMQQQKFPELQEIWSEGNKDLSPVVHFRRLSEGYGNDARKLQYASPN
jgi:hypothetical protein